MADVTGTAANDVLAGTNDDDRLNGLSGADKMAGGDGNDTYFVDQAGDVVTELKNNGLYDAIVSSVSTKLGANVEDLELVGSALNGTGNALDNTILGNSLGNTIDGAAGHDFVAGNGGNDTLTGGAGNDYLDGGTGQNLLIGGDGDDSLSGWLGASIMQGGFGNDFYSVDSADDVVSELAGQGVDGISSQGSFDMSLRGKNVENLYLSGANLTGIGNDLDNVIEGNSSNDILEGRAGNDTLLGSNGKDTLRGEDGNDTLDGGEDGDDLSGGKGNDVYYIDNVADVVTELAGQGIDEIRTDKGVDLNDIAAEIENVTLTNKDNINAYGSALNNVLTGNAGNNTLDGREGNDSLLGGDGNDLLKGGLGDDSLIGGKGNDTYYVDSAKDAVTEKAGEGTDTVRSGISYALGVNLESLELQGSGAIDGTGNALDNYIAGNSGNNELNGAAGDDRLFGHAGDDTLQGGDGNDYLDGGDGNDRMEGGKGDEIYYVDSKDDQVVESAKQGFDAVRSSVTFDLATSGANVEGLELIGASKINGSGNSLDNVMEGNSADNLLTGAAGDDGIDGGEGNDRLEGDTGDDYLSGNDGNDTVLGGVGNDNLRGERDNDHVGGGTGHDTLDGGDGSDTMTGGAGNDLYWLSSNDTIVELAGEGIDTVISDANVDLATGDLVDIENLTLVGNAGAEGRGNGFNNVLVGNSGDNALLGLIGDDTLSGGEGNDLLRGGSGKDVVAGGRGDDIYVIDDTSDQISEKLNEGRDSVTSALAFYALGANIEDLAFDIGVAATGVGNALANNIYGADKNDSLDGKDGDDYLYGQGGDDTLVGGKGNDHLYGGLGNDAMTGGVGNDVYYVDSADDKIVELTGQGIDLVFSDINLNLFDKAFLNIENLALQGAALNATGNALANAITGNSARNIINGGAGNDRLDGAAGNDFLDGLIGDDLLLGGSGNDELLGYDGRDTLSGGDDDDYLSGEAGDDVLDGGAGVNQLHGGLGNDIYIVSGNTDTINEGANAGIDEVRASVTWSLATLANVENLTLTGSNAINGTGNALANVITGNGAGNALRGGDGNDTLLGGAGEDSLYGEAGNDKMIGGADNDYYYVDSAKDTVVEGKNQGYDIVYTLINYTLGANVEQLVIEGTGDAKGTGNALGNFIEGNDGKNKLDGAAGNDTLWGGDGDDSLIGGAGNDEITGGTGNDTMSGGAGNDTYFVGADGDKVTELAGQGIDTILTSRSFNLSIEGANVENLKASIAKNYTLIGNGLNNTITAAETGDDIIDGLAGNDSLIGGDGNDKITGGAGNDRLFGGDGNDSLEGGDGNDTLVGGTGNDVMIGGKGDDTYEYADGDEFGELEGQGIDTVVTNQNYLLGDHLENVILIGTGNYNVSGNELANVITGNTYNNLLYGLAGNDTLSGGSGEDTLDGGAGNDVMRGGTGNDIYFVNSVADKVAENANEGLYDKVVTTLSAYVLGANVERLTFELASNAVGTGNALDNAIEGGAGNDKLAGLAGNDSLRGENGNDELIGGDGNDAFDGGAGNDTLNGGAGNDSLTGRAGADLMIGGAGNDTYFVDDADDKVQEAANGGIDLVWTTIDYTLAAHVENVALDKANLTVNGNDLNNVMYGTSAAGQTDALNGHKGDDVLDGGHGNDILNGGEGNDVIEGDLGADVMDGGAGNDLFRYVLFDTDALDKLGGDLITGFEVGKDKIDLYDLFSDFGINAEDVIGDGYLRLQVNGNDTLLQFDKDGGADGFLTLATLQNVTNLALTDLIIPQGLGFD